MENKSTQVDRSVLLDRKMILGVHCQYQEKKTLVQVFNEEDSD